MLTVGMKFDSYSNFMEKLDEYKNNVFNEFWIRDSRTIEVQAKRYPEGIAAFAAKTNKQLVYCHLRVSCINGGRVYTPRNKNSFTVRQNCPAGMFVKLTSCGKFLEIKELNEEHNHPVSESLFKSVPKSVSSRHTRPKKKNVQNDSDSFVTLKDLTILNRKPQKRMQFQECISVLQNTHKCDVQILADSDANLKCIYFQDFDMKHVFESYPEIIFIDSTYCLDNNATAIYLIMVVDAEGGGEIVACGILLNETEENIDWFLKAFKKQNARACDIKVVVSDKDNKERSTFKENFPGASLQICLFHLLQMFNTEVSIKKLGLNAKDCEIAKNCLQKLAYATSENDYRREYLNMKEDVPQVVMEYFDKNLGPIEDETFGNMSFMSETNNGIVNVNAKLKSVISKFSDLESFIKMFFIIVNSFRVDRNIEYNKRDKITTTVFEPDSVEDLYSKYLTNFAFKKVQQQLEAVKFCADFRLIRKETYCAPINDIFLEITPNSCQCMFWKSFKLPCSHIFKVRNLCNQPLYDENLCLERWKRRYFESRHPCSSENTNNNSETTTEDCLGATNQCLLTANEKFKMMNDACLRLSETCNDVSDEIFYNRLELIRCLSTRWNKDYRKFENQPEIERHKEHPTEIPSNAAIMHVDEIKYEVFLEENFDLLEDEIAHVDCNRLPQTEERDSPWDVDTNRDINVDPLL